MPQHDSRVSRGGWFDFMKSTERHRLKENELVSSVTRAKETLEVYQKPLIGAIVAAVVLFGVIGGVLAWRNSTDKASRALLGEALAIERAPVAPAPAADQTTPPKPQPGAYPNLQAKQQAALQKYLAAADAYPTTQAGLAARYHAAATLVMLGKPSEAIAQYNQVVEKGGGSLYGEMAKLGVADAQVAAGQFDQAITGYQAIVGNKESQIPTDGVLMQLARAYAAAGKSADAKQAFKRVMDEFPQSPYAAAAKREFDLLS